MTTIPPHPGLSGLAAREATTPADVTRAADDDADRTRSVFDRPPRPVCGCCGPQLCCCPCHKEEA